MKPLSIFPLLLLLCLLVLPGSRAFPQPEVAHPRIYCKHFIFGYPLGAPAPNPMVIRDLYALSLNGQTKFADWVCYHLTPHETKGTLDLFREWHTDPWLHKNETLVATPKKDDEYKGVEKLKYDRGHLAPLGSFKGSRFASQVNFYSNIVPQKSTLNRGAWKNLEGKVRSLVNTYDHVWVMSGPLYEQDMPPLPKAKPHKVPSAFWTIIVASNKENPKAPKDIKVAAFIMGQETKSDYKPKDLLKSVDEVENRSKLNFFWELSASDQEKLESQNAGTWGEELVKKGPH